MTDQRSNNHDEPQLRLVLRALDAGAIPPDAAMLESLRARTQTLFDESAATQRAIKPETEEELSPLTTPNRSRHRMIALSVRGFIAVAGLAAAIAVFLNVIPPGRLSGAMRFSDVLDRLRGQQTLELRVTKEGRSAEVWIRAPGSVRWEDSPQRYRIAAGSRLWKIDEAANTVSTGDSPWFIGPKQQVDLLGLLDVGIKDSTPLLTARPVDRAEYDGHDCFVYRVDLAAQDGRVQIAAFADERSKQLVGIVAQPAGGPVGVGPPLAELRLVAMNAPVDESKFAVAKSLTDDGRIGKVSDAQGVVVVRPALSQRWTPVCREMQLRAGDWLRTDIRGANAVKARLSSEVELTLGPGTLVECISPALARLHTGEVQVSLPKQDQAVFELLAPRTGSKKFTDAGKSLFRVDRDEKLAVVKERPKWLAGFEGTSSDESLGSLIVNLPDVGNQPLAVGYHKVSVEIRDQIARTTIEESFVNHTPARLEGVFYFPLPQDASISDFGMWIGNNLVEADVVEKQRAREIYETILRERRDPGLLEWTGGNIFKARVFPIEAHSEKRIKIVYTQVLPLRANRYRYSYGLRSELLRTKPLRELSLTVTVNSALPLKSVTCPTHSARIEHTDHSAQVAFVAQEYIPTRDFEVVCEIDGRQSDVVVVPHRRGDDGYFMVQLTPPAPEGNWQRELVADGKPLELVLLCDTSASMDSEKRKQQADFVATILSSLGEKDRFWLAAADVGTVWASKEPMAPTAENVAKASEFLDQRMSLGWTNLEQAFEAVLNKAPAAAHVVYIGDGIVTAGEADPDSFVKRLVRLMDRSQPTVEQPGRVFHAVTVGNSFEATVLKAIALIGGCSVRSIGGEQTPQSVALELLKEIAEPGLRDLNVEFRGLKVAAVYPERLPNLAAGTQQVIVGRYLPAGNDQQGEIVVTGHRGSETVRYAAKVDLKDAEEGNSFIPRLWARAHLDHLLAQGQSEAMRDQIIALSEEFHIMTPYTSLLVLETDADRERFGVKRRFAMRDGEQFFAAGRDKADFELTQQQMKRAGDWRLGLRRQVLANLAQLGRDSQMFQRQAQVLRQRYERSGGIAGGGGFGGGFGPASGTLARWVDSGGSGSIGPFTHELQLAVDGSNSYAGGTALSGGRLLLGDSYVAGDSEGLQWSMSGRGMVNRRMCGLEGFDGAAFNDEELDVGLKAKLGVERGVDELSERESDFKRNEFAGEAMPVDDSELMGGRRVYPTADLVLPIGQTSALSGFWAKEPAGLMPLNAPEGYGQNGRIPDYSLGKPFYFRSHGYEPNYTAWLDTLFPGLPSPARQPEKPPKQPESWSPDEIGLANSLLRTESLKKLEGGMELRTVSESFDPRWKRRSSRHSDLALYSPTGWLTRTLDLDAQLIVNFCNAKERGVFSLSFLLGRTRKSVERDLTDLPLALSDWSLSPLNEAYRGYEVKVAKADAQDQVILILKTKGSEFEQRFLIDTARHVLLKIETFDQGKLTGAVAFTDFAEIAGSWWARHVTTTDSKGRTIAETTLDIAVLAPGKYSERIDVELAEKPHVQFLDLPFAKLKDARQRVADGSAGFDDRIVMMLHDASLQQWDEMLKQLEAIEKAAVDKPGIRWLRTVALQTIRRNDEARHRLLGEARQLAEKKQQDELYLAGFMLGQAQGVTSPAEYLKFVEMLRPLYDRQPDELDAKTRWQEELAGTFDRLGRNDDALELKRTLAERAPWDVNKQTDLARRLMQAGQADAAYDWLQKQLNRPEERDNSEDESLRTAHADLYRGQARWDDLLRFTTKWIERKPEYQSAYLQHISALVYNNQLDAANALARQWLKDAQIEGKLSADQEARLDAAISFAQGNAYYLSFYRLDPQWFEPLAEAARFFARHKERFGIVGRITDYRFTESDAYDRLRGFFLGMLETDLANLTPEQINSLAGWTLSGRIELAQPLDGRRQLNASETPEGVWRKIAEQIYRRWKQTETKSGDNDKHLLGEALRTIYATRFNDTELLPFLRERIASASAELRPSYIAALFDTLLTRKWTNEIEGEAFSLLRKLSDAEQPSDRLLVEVPALHRLVDSVLANRQAAAEQELHDRGQVDKLTRTELAKKRSENRNAARQGLAAQLAGEAAEERGPLAQWLRIERVYLDVQLDQNLADVEAECWKILGEVPPKQIRDAEATDELSDSQIQQQFFDALLRQRAFVTVMNLAARKSAQPTAIVRLLKYVDAGIAHGGDMAAPWRITKFQLLIALDRPDDLERELREWVRADLSTAPWRKALAMLLAERGEFGEAIGLFEAAEKNHLLTAADFRALADWYLIANRREAYERSRIEAFKQVPEQYLGNLFYGVRNRWLQTDRPLPSELDDNTLFAFRALFEKSANPENYLGELRELYAACRDFRLLQMLPDAVVGRSPQQIYPFLENLRSQVLVELHNEATADEIIARIKKLREGKLIPSDLRALDLTEALVERRASEVLNQPGPHVAACLAALRRAFDRQWGESEPRMMAAFLRNLETLHDPKLVDEQIRELRALADMAPAASRDHLLVTNDLCNLLFWSYGRRDEAIEQMEAEVRGYEQAHGGAWPYEDDDVLGSYVALYEGAHRHAAGEAILLKYLTKPEQVQQRVWLEDRLMQLYNNALEQDGEVTLDKGNQLFLNIVAEGVRQIEASTDENARYNLVNRLTTTFDIAQRHKLKDAAEQLRKFAFEAMPAILKRQQGQYQATANSPLHVIESTLGPAEALRYVVERMEQYPQWLEETWNSGWTIFGNELARLREEASNSKQRIEDLEPRVLKLAIRELKRDLLGEDRRNPTIYYIHYSYFWAAKAGDFANAANEVYREHKSSGRRVVYIANYLWNGLELRSRAIEILLVAYKDGILDESGQVQLVDYLHTENRFGESISILEPLVRDHPDSMPYRTRLMAAYHRTQRHDQLMELVEQTAEHFHKEGRWTEGNIAEFGRGCLDCQLLDRAGGYYQESISLHQRSNPASGVGDATLSGMYQQLAEAQSQLGHTKEAVEAASGAIVSWGSRQNERRDALNKLNQVLAHAKDLDAYVRGLDEQSAKTGQDSPILRKAIGQTYQARGDFAKAIVQFQLSIQLQPADVEVHQALIACYDATGKKPEATLQLLALIDLDPHNLPLYQQLAERLKDDEPEAERAATSIIEAGPREAENQAAMAELRQKQGRWNEAIPHWEEAARLRRLEPTNLIKLAEAELHAKQWDAARQSIERLEKTEWPSRFNGVSNDIRRLQSQLPK